MGCSCRTFREEPLALRVFHDSGRQCRCRCSSGAKLNEPRRRSTMLGSSGTHRSCKSESL
jgi:hypothetical protein